jgi:hypothetical protein
MPVRRHKTISCCRDARHLFGREDYRKELEKKITYLLYYRLLLAGPTCRGPAQCEHSPWSIKGRVHSLEDKIPEHS